MKKAVKVLVSVALTLALVFTALSVSAVKAAPAVLSVTEVLGGLGGGDPFLVEGVFVGVADEGAGYQKEIIIKDAANDSVISVQGVPYGGFSDHGYDKGDLLKLRVTAVRQTYAKDGQNKVLLRFAEGNPEKATDTVISHGNPTDISLENAALIENWEDMQSFFSAKKLQAYTLVHMKGKMYFNSYASGSDSVPIHRVHMNGAANSITSIKPDGVRAVGLRQNMLSANVPFALTSYFDMVIGSAAFPGTADDFDFYALVTAVNPLNFQLTVLDPSWLLGKENYINITNNFDVLMEVANAYYRRGNNLGYDQRFANENVTPEAITDQQHKFLDCSSFVNAVYYEAFGRNILGVPLSTKQCYTGNYDTYAKQNLGVKPDVVGYWEPPTYMTEEEKQQALNEIRNALQPGDLLNYRHGISSVSGHVMLYIGNDMFIHSSGAYCTTSASSPETGHVDRATLAEMVHGTVYKVSATRNFEDPTYSRYYMKNDDQDVMRSIAIIRPLALGLTPTEKTQRRMSIAGLSLKKTVSAGVTTSVEKGEEVGYVLTVENHSSNSYSDLQFKDVLSDKLEYLSGNMPFTVDGQTITCSFSIGPFETLKIRWNTKVKYNVSPGDRIECANTSVAGLTIATMGVSVRSCTAADLSAVADKALEYANSGATFADPLEMAKELYNETLGIDFAGDISSSADLFNDIFTPSGSYYKLNTKAKLSQFVVPWMYSGTLVTQLSSIVTIFLKSNFMPGDLIFCKTKSTYCLYVCVGDGKLVRVKANTAAKAVDSGEEVYTSPDSYFSMSTILSATRSYELCAVLRPTVIEGTKTTHTASGDLDGDGEVTDADAVYLLFNTFFPEDYPLTAPADFDGDGEMTDADAVYLLFYTFFPEDYPI